MRLKLATKISATIVGVLTLAVLSSAVALLSTWRIGSLMESTVTENLPSVRAAEELEIALLEQRGFVSSFILDGGKRDWLMELDRREPAFQHWLSQAKHTAHTPEERAILSRLAPVYRDYNAKRREVIALCEQGDVDTAKKMLLQDVHDLYVRAYNLCEEFIAANDHAVAAANARSQSEVASVTLTVAGCVAVTAALGLTLIWLFLRGVFLPLRSMVADARLFAHNGSPQPGHLPDDELHTVGIYLRMLMSDVASARTSLDRSRTELLHAEKLASVGKLAASVAHEIRNPLTSMKMWLFSIRKSVASNPELDGKFDIVSGEVTRLESIVRNFLEFARPPALDLQPQPILPIVDKTLELLSHRFEERNLRLIHDSETDLPAVNVDPNQFQQVLINILDNAVQASPDGSQVRVSASVRPDLDGSQAVVVRICDSGGGVADGVAPRIFEPFFTTKDQGTGLGLCIAARIMALHGGRVVLESSTPLGTSFAIWVPAANSDH